MKIFFRTLTLLTCLPFFLVAIILFGPLIWAEERLSNVDWPNRWRDLAQRFDRRWKEAIDWWFRFIPKGQQ